MKAIALLLSAIILQSCTTVEPTLRGPTSEAGGVRYYQIELSEEVYPVPVDVYVVGLEQKQQAADLVLHLEEMAPDATEFMKRLQLKNFRGIVVVPRGSEQDYLQFFSNQNSFDRFFDELISKLAGQITDSLHSLVLTGNAKAGHVISQFSHFQSSYFRKLGAVGLFDALRGTQDLDVAQWVASQGVGVKVYSNYIAPENKNYVSSFDTSASNMRLEKSLEQKSVAEFVVESLKSESFDQSSAVANCLPKFLEGLREEPFIHFRCVK